MAQQTVSMAQLEDYKLKPLSKQHEIWYGLGPLADQMSHQMFQFLVFTYYYAVVGIGIDILWKAFVIFAIWDSINDPLIGPLTDRTKRKERRKFWILISIIPFGLANFILFTPPFFLSGNSNEMVNAIYMVASIMLYDLVYSIFSVNQLSLFSEQFQTEEERGRGNMWKSILTIVGVIIGFVLPTIFISPLAPSEDTPQEVVDKIPTMYFLTGAIVGILVILVGFLFWKYGMNETRGSYAQANEVKTPGLLKMVKDTVSNGKFIIFCVANMVKWFVFKMLTTVVPLYAIHVLGLKDGSILISVMLLTGFLSAMAMFPFMKKLGLKIGWRNGFIVTQLFWALALIPFAFLDNQPYWAIFCMIFVGIGLAGAIYFVEPILANVIDEDELKTGHPNAGAYYGINGLINRWSTILVFAVLAIVLTGYGWGNYLIGEGMADTSSLITGLKLLMSPISIAGTLLVVLLLLFFSLHGKKLEDVQSKLAEARLRYK
jgi:GPH family glycoside/pentoside/hexuronide:cation symporter